MIFPKPRAYFLHYNKPATASAGSPRISVHVAGVCHVVTNVVCGTPTSGRVRKTQPRWVLTGKAHSFVLQPDGSMIIS